VIRAATRERAAFGVLLLALALAVAIGLAVGSVAQPTRAIFLEIRLPRVLLAGLVGAALASAGALLQPLLRNPLADPYLLGISGGAALGGVLAQVGGAAVAASLAIGAAVPACAFAGALLASAALYAVTSVGGRPAPGQSLLLCGVVFNAFASALILFVLTAADLDQVAGAFVWLIGSIGYVDPWLIAALAALVAVALAVGIHDAHALNLLTQGDEIASQLGVDAAAVRRRVLLASAALIGAAVSIAGLIGFVGLVIPHALRLVLGSDHRRIVPAAALLGAAFLIAADTLARAALPPRELPVGAFCALVGGPVFVVLLRRQLALQVR
jgi:iron complex transport system permease protein